jgi:hypothetical protein
MLHDLLKISLFMLLFEYIISCNIFRINIFNYRLEHFIRHLYYFLTDDYLAENIFILIICIIIIVNFRY